MYVKMQASVLVSIKRWSEKRLVDYHASFQRGKQVGLMETILPLVFSTTKILEEDVPGFAAAAQERNGGGSLLDSNSYGIRVDHYIRSSLRNAFTKVALHIVVCVAFFFFYVIAWFYLLISFSFLLRFKLRVLTFYILIFCIQLI